MAVNWGGFVKYDFPYDYVTLRIFDCLFSYEKKNTLSIGELKKFHKRIIKDFIDSCQNVEEYLKIGDGSNSHYQKTFISYDISFNEYDEDLELEKFLMKYSRYFKVIDDTIYFDGDRGREELSYQFLNLESEPFEKIRRKFDDLLFKKTELFRSMGIHTIEDFLRRYMEIENDIRIAYKDLVFSNNYESFEKNVSKKILIRSVLMQNLSTLDEYFLIPFKRMAEFLAFDSDRCGHFPGQSFLKAVNGLKSDEVIFPYLKMIDIINYVDLINIKKSNSQDKSGIGIEFLKTYDLWNKVKEFGGNFEDDSSMISDLDKVDCNSLDTILYDIFGLGVSRNGIDDFGKQYGFYLLYLDKLNKYMNEYGATDGLLNFKANLLYFLDRGDKFLYREDNFQKELITFRSFVTPEDYKNNLDYQKDFAFAIFDYEENISDTAVIYAINFATQYELTHDDSIRERISKYKDHKDYDLICNIIFGKKNINCKKKI